jgi:hypothetical protein
MRGSKIDCFSERRGIFGDLFTFDRSVDHDVEQPKTDVLSRYIDGEQLARLPNNGEGQAHT